MKAFRLTDNGDLDFNGSEFVMIEDLHQLAQEAEFSFGTRKGEWFLDENEGMDFSALYQKPFDENEFRTDLIESLQGTTQQLDVMEANFGNVTPDRKISLDVKMETSDGRILNLENTEVG